MCERVYATGGRGTTRGCGPPSPSAPRIPGPILSFFPSLLLFFFLSSSLSRRHFAEERGERGRDARMREEATRRNLLRRARPRGGRSYFKIRRAPRLSRPWCSRSCMRSGTYGDDPVDGWRYGRQMYYVRLNSTPPSIGSPKREQNSPPPPPAK